AVAAEDMSPGENSHVLLGRIRFLVECIDCFRNSKPLPASLCFVPKEVCYKICKDSSSGANAPAGASSCSSSAGKSLVSVWESPSQAPQSKKLFKFNIEPKKGTCIRTTGEEYCNSYGLWVKLNKEQLEEHRPGLDVEEGWLLVCKHTEGGDRLVPVESPETVCRQQQLFGYDYKPCTRWEQVVDAEYSLHLGIRPRIAEQDPAGVQKLRYVPPTWTFECDEDLVHYFYDHVGKEDENLGSVKQSVESIDVSSNSIREDPTGSVECLTDGDAETYWESDGLQGQHWIRLHMKKGTVVKKLILTVDSTDDNYMPKRITVFGGEGDNLKKLSDVNIDENLIGDVCVLEDMSSHLPVIEIRIVECRDEGIDVRIRGLKIKSSRERDLGLNADMFQSPNLVRYPRLEGTPPDVLYRRAIVIQRFISLLDSLLPHLVPAWDYTLGTFNHLKHVKQFLLLSKRRSALITQCLKHSETSKPSFMPRLYINRRLAMEHRDNPSLDPSCKNAVFTQVYEGLKPSDKYEKVLDYRWPVRYDQWWECKFISEGIIDQGGGFRDSLADMSEELCPSSAECPVPLPFFTRTSNQELSRAWETAHQNPSQPGMCITRFSCPCSCSVFTGQDFSNSEMNFRPSVTEFGQELTYTTLLSDGRMVELVSGGGSTAVTFEDRREFIRLVQKARLEENREQIAAMQAGLVKVVPQAVLDLLTWQELEKKVCGDPEITVEALKRLTRYEDLEQSDERVQYLWEALTNFTNEDRSRFLRFVTGRSRLPAPIYIFPDKQGNFQFTRRIKQPSSCLKVSFFLNSSICSAKVCEEKLRYAAYNCVAIDTDMSPWEE
uniref:HECT domain containing 3 n=1 Tax=Lepisosteus oculatus TaxID=7918 RepID=W5M5A4_LEPOC